MRVRIKVSIQSVSMEVTEVESDTNDSLSENGSGSVSVSDSSKSSCLLATPQLSSTVSDVEDGPFPNVHIHVRGKITSLIRIRCCAGIPWASSIVR